MVSMAAAGAADVGVEVEARCLTALVIRRLGRTTRSVVMPVVGLLLPFRHWHASSCGHLALAITLAAVGLTFTGTSIVR